MSESTFPVPSSPVRPFWSILIPTYEPEARYLREALVSVLQQDAGPAEMHIEVVDDGSTETDVKALVQSIAGERITVTRTPRNLGLAGCWNTCIQRAAGGWIHLLHQDDLVFPGFYAELRDTIGDFPQAAAAFCRHCFVDENSNWMGLSAIESPRRAVLEDWQFRLTSGQRIQCPSIIVRRSVYAALGGFREDLPYCLDWEMWARIAAAHPFAFSPRILAGYRSHRNSATSRLAAAGRRLSDQIRTFDLLAERLPSERRTAARQAFRRYLAPGDSQNANQADFMAAVRAGVLAQVTQGSMPVKWYLTVAISALWAKLRRQFKSSQSELADGR